MSFWRTLYRVFLVAAAMLVAVILVRNVALLIMMYHGFRDLFRETV